MSSRHPLQGNLALKLPPEPEGPPLPSSSRCALEEDGFPFEALSDIAELESWRKELNRPIYHLHKWWAQRLGTVFRAIAIGAFAPAGADALELFHRPVRFKGKVVFDPFMGSGTTLGEALKLGASAIGRDINSVAHFLVRNALSRQDGAAVLRTFQEVERDVAGAIKRYYRSRLEDGTEADVLYCFWVMEVACPQCAASVDLFPSRIFAKHADPRRHPEAKAVCPGCGAINALRHDAAAASCAACALDFNPQQGQAQGQNASCPGCGHCFPIAKTVRRGEAPPAMRLYAKLLLTPDGRKVYAAATEEDRRLYAKAEEALARKQGAYPVVAIAPGYNTNQALGYNYRHWHQMFNARQLLCLSMLAERIRAIPDEGLRSLFACLFSGILEFNNLFASYKGEGTGAVRHMFSHHILKPERTPLEANVWGTPRSSGSFMTLFKGRLLRALAYAEDPFELRPCSGQARQASTKVYGLSESLGYEIADSYAAFKAGKRVYLSCGDSSLTDLPSQSIDAVITDPPFFDNVHYSQLADFFHVWQRHLLGCQGALAASSTRSAQEVQNADVGLFTERLAAVWEECHRVLADDGVLAFTYHHSRPEGWQAVLQALMRAGFGITAAHPIKAEMSVAMPKRQAKEPIDLDIILVCRKRSGLAACALQDSVWELAQGRARSQIDRLRNSGRALSRNDVRVILMAQLVRGLSLYPSMEEALAQLAAGNDRIEALIDALHGPAVDASGGGNPC